ncbi:(Fe-S)-binding protein [Chloroflexota bacterium]
MVPHREIFWNIEFGEIIYVLGVIAVGFMVYAIYRHYRYWRLGSPDRRFGDFGRRLWAFIGATVIDIIIHRKFFGIFNGLGRRHSTADDIEPRELYPGLIHFLIFVGTIILLIGTALDVISHYFIEFMHGPFYLGYSVVTDAGGIMAIVGVILAIIRRYGQKPDRLDNKPDDFVALLLILVVVFTGFIVEGFRIAATELQTNPGWAPWSIGAYPLALLFRGLSQDVLITWHIIWWWLHSLIAIGAIIYVSLYFSRLWHIVIDPVNVFFRNLEPRGALAAIDLETAETFGVAKIEDFSWKHLMDLDACTRCGRCQDSCPAYLSGKPLSPKKIIQDLKSSLMERAPVILKSRNGGEENPGAEVKALIGEVIGEDEIWNCTTCFACQEACPVYIEPMAKLIEMRRNLVLEQGTIPETGEGALKSLEARGHPWRGTTLTRTDWAEGLDIKILAEDSDIDTLFWVGCTEALEERSTRVAQATARILKMAGINFGILGDEETCCGDPARRLGNEYLFQMQAEKNIETLKNYGIKQIVTGCPHCYNTLKYEYPQFGGEFEVYHHSEFIAGLLRDDKLRVIKGVGGPVTYHDACYLGRYNGIFEPPRQILTSIPDINLVEMARNRERGFCCGAGGGHLWLEEQKAGERINEMRTEQAIDRKAQIIATACPYCLQMFEDGIKAKGAEESLRVMDVAELLAQSALYRPYLPPENQA